MTDMQWMLVLHISLIVLNALIAIVQYLLSRDIKEVRKTINFQAKNVIGITRKSGN